MLWVEAWGRWGLGNEVLQKGARESCMEACDLPTKGSFQLEGMVEHRRHEKRWGYT